MGKSTKHNQRLCRGQPRNRGPRFSHSTETDFQKEFSTRILDTSRVFSLSGELHKLIACEADRVFVIRRIKSYLSRGRRGKLSLPRRLHNLQTLLDGWSRSDIRANAFWVKPNDAFRVRLEEPHSEITSHLISGGLWNPPKRILVREANEVDKIRLRAKDTPRISRRLWPSTPTFAEMLVATRSGMSCPGFTKPPELTDNSHIRRVHMNNIRVATRVVTDNVIGIRAFPLTVPSKFLRWFRYHQGFLILTGRYNIPSGLVRFLLSTWKTCPRSLWLRRPCLLKYYLKSTLFTDPGEYPEDDSDSESSYWEEDRHPLHPSNGKPLHGPLLPNYSFYSSTTQHQ